MLGWNFKVAIAQSQNEIAWLTQATEEGALATKTMADFFAKTRKKAILTPRRTNSTGIIRSLPFIAFEAATVASSEALL